MCLFEKSRIRLIAIVISSLFLTYLIAILSYCSILTGRMRPEGVVLKIDTNATMQLFVISLSIAINIFGLFAFIFNKNTLVLFYSVINSYILILTFWITVSLFLLADSSSSAFWISDNLSLCFNKNTTESNFSYTNDYRFKMDYFITSANDNLCTIDCPCKLSNQSKWNISPESSLSFSQNGASNFQGCNKITQEKALNQSRKLGFKENDNCVFKTMSFLEEQFNCTGFCIQTYTSRIDNRRRTIQKYLFTNINRGTPKQGPCIMYLIEWIKSTCKEFGIMDIFIMIFNLALIIIGYSYYLSFHHDKENPAKIETTELKNIEKEEVNDENQETIPKENKRKNVYFPASTIPASESIHVSTTNKI
jgi:hypothetical protein